MSCEDGLVMTVHPGVRRNHHGQTFERYGADVGADIPIQVEFTDALRPLLQRFGTAPGFHLVVFTVDETVWSRSSRRWPGSIPRSMWAFRGGSWTRRTPSADSGLR